MALQLRKLGAPINDLQVAPVQQPGLNPAVQIATPQPLQVGNQVIQPSPDMRTGVAPPPLTPTYGIGPYTDFLGTAAHDIGSAAASTGTAIGQIASTPYNAGKLAFDQSANRLAGRQPNASTAAQNANTATNRDINTAKQFVQFLPRAAVQLRNSAAEGLGGSGGKQQLSNFVPHGGLEKALLGDQPIQSLQGVYKTTRQQKGTQEAAVSTGLTAAMDALALKGGVDSVAKLTAHASPVVRAAAQATLDKVNSGQLTPLNEVGAVGKNVNEGQPEILNHYTTPENAKALKNGADFNYSQAPQHGMGGKGALIGQGGTTGKFVSDGGPALYLSRDDKLWSNAAVPTGKPEIVNIDNLSLDQLKNGYLQKNGITEQYDYTKQKYVGVKNATKDVKLSPVAHQIDPNARRLVIDSPAALAKVTKETGQATDSPNFWAYLRQKYDVVDIKNVAKNIKNSATDSREQKFFRSAKGDQSIVLNPKVADRIESNGLPASMNREFEQASLPITEENNPDQYAEMMDNLPAPKPRVSLKTTSPISGRTVDPQALADLPPAEQMKLYGQENPSTFNGPSLKLKSQQPETKLSLTAQTPKAAIGENTYIMGEHSRKFNNAINIGSKLNKDDKAKLSDALNGRDVGPVDKPALFNKTVAALKDSYDNSLAVNRLAGGQTARFNKGNFSPLYLKADTARLDELGVPKDEQYDLGNGQSMYVQAGEDSPLTSGKFKGYRNIQRKYADYQDAAEQSKGILQPANANALEDARMYANQAHRVLEGNLLYKQLKKLAPSEVSSDLNQKYGANGEPLVHAANGQLPFNVSKSLNRQLTGFKSNRITNPIGEAAFKAPEVISKGLRKVAFLGAPIHYANLSRSFLSTTIPSGHGITAGRGIGEALGASLHPKVYAALQDAADKVRPGQEFSAREFAGKIGIVDRDTRPNLLAKGTGFKGKVEKYSPFALQMRNLNRFNNVLGWKLAERVQELGVQAGTKDATAIGTEINKVIDRINPKMEGLNPIGERLATSGSLAPHWIRANIGLVKDALKTSVPNLGIDTLKAHGFGTGKTGFGLSNAGDIARTNVIAGRILFGATAILASALATGQMPTFHKALNEAGFNPNNPYPNIEGKSKTKAKYPGAQQYGQVTNLPSDPIGLAVGLLTDPKHFAIARETPALSAATQAITNQDFFGNPVVDKSQPGWEKKLAIATAEKLIPFTGQNVLNKSLTPGQKAEAAVGLRTKTNPNDPNYIQTQAHFQGITNAKNGLDTQAARAVDEYTASKKNPLTGQYIAPTVDDQRAKATGLLQNPTAIAALAKEYAKEASTGGKVDPLWLQGTDKITKVLQYQAMPPGGADRTHWETLNGSWYNPLAAQRSDFFGSLPPGDPNKPQAPIAYPTASPDVAAAQKQFFAITDAKSRAQYIQDHPEVQQQLDAQVAYNNELRQAQGYSALDTFPAASPDVQKIINTYNALPQHDGSKGGNKSRSLWITAHPAEYKQMSDYYTQSSIYSLQKEAGQSQFADTGPSQKLLSDAYNLGQYDIVKNKDGTFSLGDSYSSSGSGSSGSSSSSKKYTVSSSSSSGSSGGRKYVSRTAAELQNPFFDALDIGAGGKKNIGKAEKPKTSKTASFKAKPAGYQPKVTAAVKPAKLKLKLKSSRV